MGCCFSRELNAVPPDERSGLLQPPPRDALSEVTEQVRRHAAALTRHACDGQTQRKPPPDEENEVQPEAAVVSGPKAALPHAEDGAIITTHGSNSNAAAGGPQAAGPSCDPASYMEVPTLSPAAQNAVLRAVRLSPPPAGSPSGGPQGNITESSLSGEQPVSPSPGEARVVTATSATGLEMRTRCFYTICSIDADDLGYDLPHGQPQTAGAAPLLSATEGGAASMPGSPPHMPGSPAHMPGSPAHMPGSPPDMPGAPPHMPGSPAHMPGSPPHMPGSPAHMPGAPPHIPGSPAHIPGSPAHMTGAAHMPGSPAHMAGSPAHSQPHLEVSAISQSHAEEPPPGRPYAAVPSQTSIPPTSGALQLEDPPCDPQPLRSSQANNQEPDSHGSEGATLPTSRTGSRVSEEGSRQMSVTEDGSERRGNHRPAADSAVESEQDEQDEDLDSDFIPSDDRLRRAGSSQTAETPEQDSSDQRCGSSEAIAPPLSAEGDALPESICRDAGEERHGGPSSAADVTPATSSPPLELTATPRHTDLTPARVASHHPPEPWSDDLTLELGAIDPLSQSADPGSEREDSDGGREHVVASPKRDSDQCFQDIPHRDHRDADKKAKAGTCQNGDSDVSVVEPETRRDPRQGDGRGTPNLRDCFMAFRAEDWPLLLAAPAVAPSSSPPSSSSSLWSSAGDGRGFSLAAAPGAAACGRTEAQQQIVALEREEEEVASTTRIDPPPSVPGGALQNPPGGPKPFASSVPSDRVEPGVLHCGGLDQPGQSSSGIHPEAAELMMSQVERNTFENAPPVAPISPASETLTHCPEVQAHPSLSAASDDEASPQEEPTWTAVDPAQIDAHASTPSYQIHPLGLEPAGGGDGGIRAMVSELLGDAAGASVCRLFPEPWIQLGLEGGCSGWARGASDGESEDSADFERIPALVSEPQPSMALLGAFPYSTVTPLGGCVWDWHTPPRQPGSAAASSLNPDAPVWTDPSVDLDAIYPAFLQSSQFPNDLTNEEGYVSGNACLTEAAPQDPTDREPRDDPKSANPPAPEERRQQVGGALKSWLPREQLLPDLHLPFQKVGEQNVPVQTLAGPDGIRSVSSDLQLVPDVLTALPLVQVSPCGQTVRPVQSRNVVILREIPNSTPQEEVEALFARDDLPKFLSCEFVNNNSFITFQSEAEAHQAYEYLREEVRVFKGKPIMARIKAQSLAFASYAPTNGDRPAQLDYCNHHGSYLPPNADLQPCGHHLPQQWLHNFSNMWPSATPPPIGRPPVVTNGTSAASSRRAHGRQSSGDQRFSSGDSCSGWTAHSSDQASAQRAFSPARPRGRGGWRFSDRNPLDEPWRRSSRQKRGGALRSGASGDTRNPQRPALHQPSPPPELGPQSFPPLCPANAATATMPAANGSIRSPASSDPPASGPKVSPEPQPITGQLVKDGGEATSESTPAQMSPEPVPDSKRRSYAQILKGASTNEPESPSDQEKRPRPVKSLNPWK